jgi:hypothetical protein
MGNAASAVQWIPDRRTGRLEPIVRAKQPHLAKTSPARAKKMFPPGHLDTWNEAERREQGHHIAHNNFEKNLEQLRARLALLALLARTKNKK